MLRAAMPAILLSLLALGLQSCARESADAARAVDGIADEVLTALLAEQPEQAYFAGIDLPRHDGLTDNSPGAIAARASEEDGWLARLREIDSAELSGKPQWITYGGLREALEAAVQLRACRQDWWTGVNHMASWHTTLVTLAERQPVDTADHRAQALARWTRVAAMIRQEIANLREGLTHGYSAARPVAERMLRQVDGLIASPLEEHPYADPARRSDDVQFQGTFTAIIGERVLPALREYRAFLADTYIGAAREELSVLRLPDGAACYAAMLRGFTTLPRDAAEIYALGEGVVETNREVVRAMGRTLFGTDSLPEIMAKIEADATNRLSDHDALLAGSRELVQSAQAAMPRYFGDVPPQAVVVEPIPEFQDGAGASSRYEPAQENGAPATYRISLLTPGGTSRSEAEITAFHETWPGHHLQIAYAQRIQGLHPVNRLFFNSGFVEGWARYAEALAEEAELYSTDYAKIQRRAWPARGMVVDPGIHAFGWTREQAIEFIMESGRYTQQSASQMVDRIAALPGQLTAYDSGAQEILALRREAEEVLGTRFDLRAFHDAVLGNGTVPLPMLRIGVQRWIDAQRSTE